MIGSVLLNRPARYSQRERSQIRDAVAQSAPVLANLRNLAIAELRASTDSLTGLPNKRAVADTLQRMLAQATRTQSPLSLLVLDLDHFKTVNDRLGHPVGDQILANVGAALRSALRDGDFAGRNGGEEFTVILPDTDVLGALTHGREDAGGGRGDRHPGSRADHDREHRDRGVPGARGQSRPPRASGRRRSLRRQAVGAQPGRGRLARR